MDRSDPIAPPQSGFSHARFAQDAKIARPLRDPPPPFPLCVFAPLREPTWTTTTKNPLCVGRQGVVESPWERLVGGVILGKEEESLRVLKEAGGDRQEQTPVRRGKAAARPEWEAMVKATEDILGQEWSDMILRHGDWGRDGLLAVATRHLGWRLGEVVGREPGVNYAAAEQGIRRFWKRAPNNPEMQAFVTTLLDQLSNGQI
jgi:hypothetical protein